MPSVSIAQVRRQSVFEPFLPAEPARPASSSAPAKAPSPSSSTAKGTPSGTIVALTVAAVVLAIAFGLLFAYFRRRYREEMLNGGYGDSNTAKEAKAPRRPEGSSRPGGGTTHGGNGDIMVSKPSTPSQPPSSGSSSESSSSYYSCEGSKDSYSARKRPLQRPKPSYQVPPRRPPIRTPKAPTPRYPKPRYPKPRYPKPRYPQRPGRYPGASGDPRTPPRGNQDSWGSSGTRPPQPSHSSRSRGPSQGFGPTGNDQPSFPSPSLADVLPSDILGALSAGSGTSGASRHSPPTPSDSAPASVSEILGNWSLDTSSSGRSSLPSIDTYPGEEGSRIDWSGNGTQPTPSQLSNLSDQPTIIESFCSTISYVRERPENATHNPYDRSRSARGPVFSDISESEDFDDHSASDRMPGTYPEYDSRPAQERRGWQY